MEENKIIVFAPPGEIPSVVGQGIAVSTWEMEDIPTKEKMAQYLLNLNNLREVLSSAVQEQLPTDMENLTFSEANSIEKMLLQLQNALNRMESTFPACGEAICGGDYL